MAKLVCRALRCVEETDEVGDDDVYMVIFRGSVGQAPQVNVAGGKDTAWGNMKTGKLVTKDVVLDPTYSAGDAYVIALLEQDWAKDTSVGAAWAKISEFWANNWSTFKGDSGRELCAGMALAIGLDNDEVIGIKSVPQIFASDGGGALLVFVGDGGKYRARIVKRS